MMDVRTLAPLAVAAAICFTFASGCMGGDSGTTPAPETTGTSTPEGGKGADNQETSSTGSKLASNAIEGDMTTAVIKVDGMTCGGCRGEVKEVLSGTPGVKDCTVDESGAVTITFDDAKTDKEKLVAAVNSKTDFKASL
jgi:mercuric ion binding protein